MLELELRASCAAVMLLFALPVDICCKLRLASAGCDNVANSRRLVAAVCACCALQGCEHTYPASQRPQAAFGAGLQGQPGGVVAARCRFAGQAAVEAEVAPATVVASNSSRPQRSRHMTGLRPEHGADRLCRSGVL